MHLKISAKRQSQCVKYQIYIHKAIDVMQQENVYNDIWQQKYYLR